MILPNSYETILDKIKQDWFMAGWDAAEKEDKCQARKTYVSVETQKAVEQNSAETALLEEG